MCYMTTDGQLALPPRLCLVNRHGENGRERRGKMTASVSSFHERGMLCFFVFLRRWPAWCEPGLDCTIRESSRAADSRQ
jgi:hypothetical protein